MQEYISKQQQVLRPAEQIYAVISRFDNLTPALADKVEEWQATEDSCSFKAKGFTVKLRMEEREPGKYVKVVGDDGGVPMDFAFWIQLAGSLRRGHPPAAGAAHRPEHDDEDDDRQQAARGAGSDRRGDRPGDERRPAGLNKRRTKSGTEPEHRARFRRHDAPG